LAAPSTRKTQANQENTQRVRASTQTKETRKKIAGTEPPAKENIVVLLPSMAQLRNPPPMNKAHAREIRQKIQPN
jgi:hypothetical protein